MTRAATVTRRQGWWQTISAGLVTFSLIAAAALVVVLVVVPKVLGGMSLTVLTGSMRPGISPGDVVVTRGIDVAAAADLRIGDVITFLPFPDDPTLVTHRIIGKSVGASGTWFITQGDNNNAPDAWNPVGDFQVRGKLVYVIPWVGWVRQWVGQAGPWVLPGVGAVLIVGGIVSLIVSGRRRPQAEPDEDDTLGSGVEATAPPAYAAPRRVALEVAT